MSKQVVLTTKAEKELQKELKERLGKIRDAIANELEEARSQGDISENSWYDAALEKRDHNDKRIDEIQKILKDAEVVDPDDGDNSFVEIGNIVKVEIHPKEDDSKKVEKVYEIVSETQANPGENKISIESPVGKILVGRKVNECVDFKQPNGSIMCYRILEITCCG